MTIKLLSSDIISKISAGEVVARPVSVVKELVENSLDAKADNIKIYIEEGGKNLIRIEDNGLGIAKEDLKKVILNHTTSKYKGLDTIDTYGFRGEALASIAAVSEVSLSTKTDNNENAYKLIKDEVFITQREIGTTIEVLNLFWKTPARLKFLQSNSFESNLIMKYIKNVAIGSINVKFTLFKGDKKVKIYEKSNSLIDRISTVLNSSNEDFFEINKTDEQNKYQITGVISKNHITYNTRENIYFFVNNRIVRNRVLINAFIRSYKDIMLINRFPGGVIFIELPLQDVDVNVSPDKTEVRFVNEKQILDLIQLSIHEKIIFSGVVNHNSNTSFDKKTDDVSSYSNKIYDIISNRNLSYISSEPMSSNNADFKQFNRPNSYHNSFIGLNNNTNIKNEIADEYHRGLKRDKDLEVLKNKKVCFEQQSVIDSSIVENSLPLEVLENKKHEISNNNRFELGYAISQIDKLYILSCNSNNEYFLIDMHAAHERIIFEGLNRDKLKIINLLPVIINVQDEEKIDYLKQNISKLYVLGFDVRYENNRFILHSIPSFLSKIDISDSILKICNSIDSIKDFCDEVKKDIGCRMAIKKGMILSIQEMNFLLRDMENTPNISHCNHGRRVFIKISHDNIKKFFNR